MEQFNNWMPFPYYCHPNCSPFMNNGLPLQTDLSFHQNVPQMSSNTNNETAFQQLQKKYDKIVEQNQQLKGQLATAHLRIQKCLKSASSKRKIKRRKEDELDKKHRCCYDDCKKEYASILALNLHMKIKHNGGTKKQRDDLAKQILLAERHGRPTPKRQINLPSGFVQKYKRDHLRNVDSKKIKIEENN